MSNELSGPSFVETVDLPDGRKVLLLSDIHMDCLGCDKLPNVPEVDNSMIDNRLKKLFEADPTKRYDIYLEIGDRFYPFAKPPPTVRQIGDIVRNSNKHSSDDYSGYMSRVTKRFGRCFNSDILQKRQTISQDISIYDNDTCYGNVNYHAVNIRHLYDSNNIREEYMKDIRKFREDFKNFIFRNIDVNSPLIGSNTLFTEIKRLYEEFKIINPDKAKMLKAITENRFSNVDQTINTTKNPKRFDVNEGSVIFDLYTCLLIEERKNGYIPTNIIIYAGASHIYYIKEYFLLYTRRQSIKYQPTTNYVLHYDLLLHYADTSRYMNPLEYNVNQFQPENIIRTSVSSFLKLVTSNLYSRCINDFDLLAYFGVPNEERSRSKDYNDDMSDKKLIVLDSDVNYTEAQIGKFNLRIFRDDNTNIITIMNKIDTDDHVMFEYLGDTTLVNRIACLKKIQLNRNDNTITTLINTNATIYDNIFQLLSSFEQSRESDEIFIRGSANRYMFKGDSYTFKGPCIHFQSSFSKTIKDKYRKESYYATNCEVANYDDNGLRDKVQNKYYNNTLLSSTYRNGKLISPYIDYKPRKTLIGNPHLLRSIYLKPNRQSQQETTQSVKYGNDKSFMEPVFEDYSTENETENNDNYTPTKMKIDKTYDDDYYLKNPLRFYGGDYYRADEEDLLFETGKSTLPQTYLNIPSTLTKRGYTYDKENKYLNISKGKLFKPDDISIKFKDQTYNDYGMDSVELSD
jgi:hypothetical protein